MNWVITQHYTNHLLVKYHKKRSNKKVCVETSLVLTVLFREFLEGKPYSCSPSQTHA